MNMNNVCMICIPTYNRKTPHILKLISEQSNCIFNLCVRHEELESGFYDSFKNIKSIKLIDLGFNIHDLGETRRRIINLCISQNAKYCLMLDDGVDSIINCENPFMPLSAIINIVIDKINKDTLVNKVIGFTFYKQRNVKEDGTSILLNTINNYKYFGFTPSQTVLLNIEMLKKYHINYSSISKHGIEDLAFFGDCLKKGLIFCSDKNFVYSGLEANMPKLGESHNNETFEENEKRYDNMNIKCFNYLHMQGVLLEKRVFILNNQIHYLSLLAFDLNYFRDALCVHRKEYAKVIASHFNLPTCK